MDRDGIMSLPVSLAGRDNDDLLTLEEAASYLRCDRSTANKLTVKGLLPAIRTTEKRKAVRVGDLRDYVTANRTPKDSAKTDLNRWLKDHKKSA